MPAFVLAPFIRRDTAFRRSQVPLKPSFNTQSQHLSVKQLRFVSACASAPSPNDQSSVSELLFEDLVSDDEYVVVDGKDVMKLVEELQKSGMDGIGIDGGDDDDGDEGFAEDFLTLAEKRTDEWSGRSDVQTTPASKSVERKGSKKTGEAEGEMDYFLDDHLEFMPSWAADAYRSGQHTDLLDGASRVGSMGSSKRLNDIVDRTKVLGAKEAINGSVGDDGIVDCTAADVADDYCIPIEFVVDAMLYFGVPSPINPSESIRNTMTTEEIGKMLHLITSFDAQDLGDRYSDRTIAELADIYDIPVENIIGLCEKEGLYICLGEQTRLSTAREDRVLDIILKGADLGRPYPPLLDGLVREASP